MDGRMKPLDIARLRRNWDRALGAAQAAPPASAPAPEVVLDPYAEAERWLLQIRRLVRADFERYEPRLTPFLDEAAALLGALRGRPSANGEAVDDPNALRAALQKTLWDIEDLLEVYSMQKV
ncbi:MAG TPA: hypothetical protein VKY73_15930 [Polyangiaceae bacterium]|nr:hypothetical protein [Polyangiaceae bacterium]